MLTAEELLLQAQDLAARALEEHVEAERAPVEVRATPWAWKMGSAGLDGSEILKTIGLTAFTFPPPPSNLAASAEISRVSHRGETAAVNVTESEAVPADGPLVPPPSISPFDFWRGFPNVMPRLTAPLVSVHNRTQRTETIVESDSGLHLASSQLARELTSAAVPGFEADLSFGSSATNCSSDTSVNR